MYWIKRKISQVKNVIRWIPTIWNQFDFDYGYSVNVFKFQLEKQAKYFDSDRSRGVSSKNDAMRIRTTLRLMEKVYDEDYAMEYQTKLKELYGEELMGYTFKENSFLKQNYELTESPERIKEISDMSSKLFMESDIKQKKAHRILWLMVERNIQSWWD